jgi:6-phosphogluconolactonase
VQGPSVYNSVGGVPYGFAFNQRGALIVSEAATNSVSSYRLRDGQLSAVTSSAQTFQQAPCWVAVSDSGKWAYTTDSNNGFITGYKIAHDGSLTILNADGNTANPGGTPLDLAFSNNSQFLYALNGGSHSLNAYSVNGNGSLTPINVTGISLPASAVGVVAR